MGAHGPPDWFEVTGNDYVALTHIDAGAGIHAVNVMHGALGGLVEWTGDGAGQALLVPEVRIGGTTVPLADLRWRRLERWIPQFTAELPGGTRLTGVICAPAGYPAARGFFIRLELENGGRAPADIDVALRINWHAAMQWVATGRALPGARHLRACAGSTLALEIDGGPALVVDAGPGAELHIEAGADTAGALHAVLSRRLTAAPRVPVAAVFFVGAARERDGAAAAAGALRRTGAEHWLRQARLELSHVLRAGHDHRWSDLLNRNLIFNRYFGTARGIDDDRLYLLRSRSTRCPAPALFNEREALFWTLPALVLADPGIAREALFRALDVFSERSGEYLRYLDGGGFDPAFSLEQALLYAWAIDRYVSVAGDPTILEEPLVRQVILECDGAVFMRLHPEQLLAGTEVLPSGDAADHPFSTTGNVLLWWFCEALPRLLPPNGEEPPRFAGAGAEVSAAVWQYCVTELHGSPVLASSVDLQGGSAVYDDPAFSLSLLPFLDFCPADDPIWTASMEFLRSAAYPLWREGAVPGLAARSDPTRARTAALCTDLLGPASADALDRLLRVRLPAGVAAAAWDPADGTAAEACHGALAGLLAWTLVAAAEAAAPAPRRRGRAR
jgi:uncharacterized protein